MTTTTRADAGFEIVRHELRVRMLDVRRVDALSVRMRRITLGGAALQGFVSAAPDDHVKVLFPPPGAAEPALPSFGPRGAEFPPGIARPPMRDYTPRHIDLAREELTLDFVLHGDGPASTWAASAAPGQRLAIAGPRGSRMVTGSHTTYLLAGDETALPAIGRWLEHLPATKTVMVFAEVGSAAEQIELPAHPGLQLRWLYRHGADAGTTPVLLNALRDTLLPESDAYAWIAAESSQMRAVRTHLTHERGWPRNALYGAGYWKRGAADHDDEH